MKEIQKSSQVIKFSDSVFDSISNKKNDKESEFSSYTKFNFNIEMLKSSSLVDSSKKVIGIAGIKKLFTLPFKNENRYSNPSVKREQEEFNLKNVKLKFEDLFKIYYETEETEISEIICTYGPLLLFGTCKNFYEIILKEMNRLGDINKNCFGNVFEEKNLMKIENLKKCFDFYFKTMDNNNNFDSVIDDVYLVEGRKLKSFLKLDNLNFNAKEICENFLILEVQEFLKLNNLKIFKGACCCKCTTNICANHDKNNNIYTVNDFISVYNRLTNILISKILEKNSKESRGVIVQRILKLTKHFARIGAFNSLKACMAALQSSSVHRLHVIKEQGIKYQKRFEEMSHVTSSENNFEMLRKRESCCCLVPWMGIILRDFTFIKEMSLYKYNNNKDVNLVDIHLAICLRKLMNSVMRSHELCREHLARQNLKKIAEVAVGKKWLMTCEIVYESEQLQFDRSKQLS